MGDLGVGDGGVAFGEAQARARGHLRRRIGGGEAVLLADDQAARFVEEGRGLGLLHGDADADAVVGAGADGNGEARAQGFLVPFKFGGLAACQERSHGLALELQNHFAGFGRGELHGEDTVLKLEAQQFGGGVDDLARHWKNASTRGTIRFVPWKRRAAATAIRRPAR